MSDKSFLTDTSAQIAGAHLVEPNTNNSWRTDVANAAMFYFNNDDLGNATGWIKADDGILVLDQNNNGIIDNGIEVFGDSTIKKDNSTAQHGFDALSDLDDNRDGRIDALDTHFNDLKVA